MKARRRSAGQSLVEFALVLPLFAVMTLGLVDSGRAIWSMSTATHAANEAARFAAVHGALSDCPVGPAAASLASLPTPLPAYCTQPTVLGESDPTHAVSKTLIRKAVMDSIFGAGGADVTIHICYGANCSGDTDTVGVGNSRGVPVTVTVQVRTPMLTGSLIHINAVTMSATTTMLVNH